MALCAAFDVAGAFALSFGISKFQLAQAVVELVGEYVGREGRSPNPELVEAIHKWPPVLTLKDLHSLLGTMNYVRPHAGPEYARPSSPLRPLLKPGAVFPPTPAQQECCEALKKLFTTDSVLGVINEKAAMEAAIAWNRGDKPAGLPFENQQLSSERVHLR